MTALGLQQLATDFTTRMRNKEGLRLWIALLAAEAFIRSGLICRLVILATLWATPVGCLLTLGWHKFAQMIIMSLIASVLLLLRLHLHLHYAVVGPALYAI